MKIILLIEDNPDIRDLVKLVLENEGYKILLAKNGFEGILQAKEGNPDLILCDFHLPDKSGLTIYKELAAVNSLNPIPFLFLSGEKIENFVDDFDVSKLHQIQKPFLIDELLDKIKNILP